MVEEEPIRLEGMLRSRPVLDAAFDELIQVAFDPAGSVAIARVLIVQIVRTARILCARADGMEAVGQPSDRPVFSRARGRGLGEGGAGHARNGTSR